MTRRPPCILYTRDPDLARELGTYLRAEVRLDTLSDTAALEARLRRTGAALAVLDLTQPDALDVAARLANETPGSVVIAVGAPRSEPVLEAERLELFAVEAADAGRRRWQSLIRSAVRHYHALQACRMPKSEPAADERAAGVADSGPAVAPLAFTEAFRHFEDLPAFLARLVENIARVARVARVGLFVLDNRSGHYRFAAGVRCLSGASDREVADHADLAQWLSDHAHVVFRGSIERVADELQDRLMLIEFLDAYGAEAIAPLYGRDRMTGWLFVGRRVTGAPFGEAEVERLAVLAEHVALLLDNALLYEEVTVQKTLAETVLQSIPVGIIAVDAAARVRWFNAAAERLLGVAAAAVAGEPAARLGSRLAHVLLSAMESAENIPPASWQEHATGRALSVTARALRKGSGCLGAVAMLHDLTQERLLRSKQDELERTAFWTELAAAMSHEVRNPLVAISTFAQLLPERYNDVEFRDQFSVLVAQEIGRLNGMIDQINTFANPQDLVFAPVNADGMLIAATKAALIRTPAAGNVRIERHIAPDLPRLWGDEAALVDACAHLIANALEAVARSPEPKIDITVAGAGVGDARVCLTIRDNGHGIPPAVGDKAFSPFYTTKARGIGLGLPLARRIVTDHGGEITIQTGSGGTTVTVKVPAHVPEKEFHEARARG